MVPRLVWAQSVYIWIQLFQHSHTHTHTRYKYIHYWWWVGRMRRKRRKKPERKSFRKKILKRGSLSSRYSLIRGGTAVEGQCNGHISPWTRFVLNITLLGVTLTEWDWPFCLYGLLCSVDTAVLTAWMPWFQLGSSYCGYKTQLRSHTFHFMGHRQSLCCLSCVCGLICLSRCIVQCLLCCIFIVQCQLWKCCITTAGWNIWGVVVWLTVALHSVP